MGDVIKFPSIKITVGDNVKFISGMFGSAAMSGFVTDIKDGEATVKVNSGNFKNCTFTVALKNCTLAE